MKHYYSDEFDIYEVYQKLTSKSTPRVRACDFFKNGNELQLLQNKMNALSQMRHKVMHHRAK